MTARRNAADLDGAPVCGEPWPLRRARTLPEAFAATVERFGDRVALRPPPGRRNRRGRRWAGLPRHRAPSGRLARDDEVRNIARTDASPATTAATPTST